jgi:hypothetical protein
MIIAWEPLPPRAAAVAPDALPRLLAWAASVGAWCEPIEVRAGADGGRGVVARRDVARGERLVTVPRAAMITDVDVARDLAAVGWRRGRARAALAAQRAGAVAGAGPGRRREPVGALPRRGAGGVPRRCRCSGPAPSWRGWPGPAR